MRRPTIRDVATSCGVSESAASFALNGRPGVSEATRARVLAAADELGWRPNPAARALAGARAGAVGLVLARAPRSFGRESFHLQLVAGMEEVLADADLALVLQAVPTVERELATYRRWWSEGRVDAVLVTDLRVEDPRPALIAELGLRAVLVGGPDPSGVLRSVSVDDAAAMTEVVEHLAALGHRRLAHVAGFEGLLHTRRRRDALLAATRRLDLDVDVQEHTDYTGAEGAAATEHLLDRDGPGPTAVVYDNELLAVGGLGVLARRGLRVPEDVAVVAWEDSPLCRAVHPPLTALTRDPYALGSAAARSLLALVRDGAVEDRVEPVPELAVRASTAGI